MRVIITGGTGLIGSALCRQLVAEQHEVIVLSRNPDAAPSMASGVQLQKWDARSAAGWGHWADGAGAIVNLAGEGIGDGRWTRARKQRIRQSRIQAGMAVREAIEQATDKPKVLVQASGVDYYGPCGDEVLTEAAAPGDSFLAKVCTDWELSTVAVEQMGVRRPILRTSVVLSTDGGALPKLLLPFKFFAGGPLGSGKQWMSWIHIRDEVRAIQFLLEHESADGPFNLAAPNPVTNRAFSDTVGKVMGRPAFLPAPAFALQTVLGEMSSLLLDGQRAMPQKLEALGFTFDFPTLESALGDLLK